MTEERMTPALEACPCCASTNLVPPPKHWPDGVVYCRDCGLRGSSPEAWNQRASPAPEPVAAMEPVAWMHPDQLAGKYSDVLSPVTTYRIASWTPLYAHPPADPLMDEVREALEVIAQGCSAATVCNRCHAADHLARKLLAKLGERK